MKRLVSMMMTLILALNMFPTAALAVETDGQTDQPEVVSENPSQGFVLIDSNTQWTYLDNNTDPAGTYERTSWTAADYEMGNNWKTGVSPFGAKCSTANGTPAKDLGGGYVAETLLDGCNKSSDTPAYFFRTTVNIADASKVTALSGSLIHDDGVTMYINGTRVFGDGDETGITEGKNQVYYGDSHQDAPCTCTINLEDVSALVDGENVIAVEIHQDRASSSDVFFALSSLTATVDGQEQTLINAQTEWSYLDDGGDPAGEYERTSWTAEDYQTNDKNFDSTAWKTAAGPFGSKKGGNTITSSCIANTILAGTDGKNDTPAYFFRATFDVTAEELATMNQLTGTVSYDDALIIYINGQRVAAYEDEACDANGNKLGVAISENLQYGGSNGGDPRTSTFTLTDLSDVLHAGPNTIAAELHQGRATSSDVWFNMSDLSLSKVEPEVSNISLSMGADQTQMNFTWHCTTQDDGTLLIAENSAVKNDQMPAEAASYRTTPVINNDGKYTNKAVATDLKPGTTYAYQIVNGDVKSEIKTFTTDDGGAFSFAYVADPQIGASGKATSDTDGWEQTLNIIDNHERFSGVSFLLSAGDQVNTANSESEYDGYLDHEALNSLPVATVIGNHDSDSNAYKQHFNVPNEDDTCDTSTAAGSDYWFVYNNVLFMVLNSNDLSAAEHKAFMEKAIAANPNVDWKVVSFHHSIYTVASHYNNDRTDRRETLTPIFKELDIDVVLQGHDHVYCRTYMMDGLSVSANENYTYGNGRENAPTAVTDPEGILYITANSGSGSKHYNIVTNVEFPYAAVQNQERIPNASRIDVTENAFTITTYRTTDLSVVDTFTIHKTTQEAPSSKPSSPSAPTSYAVSLEDMENGSVTASSKSAAKGSTVTLTVTPDEGYELADLTVTDKSGKELTLTQKGDGVYTFTMPASKVTVSADFQKIETPVSQLPFTDVAEKDWFYEGVSFVYENGIMNGLTTSTFGPSAATTRGMVVTMLWRMEDQPQAQNGAAFADVKEGAYYAQAIDWAAENGIVNGTSDTTFSPDQDVTRQQLAAILYRYSQYKGYDVTAQGDLTAFGDWEQVSSYAVEAMEWAVGSALIQGIDDNLVPGGSATRAQLATIFSRFITNFGS